MLPVVIPVLTSAAGMAVGYAIGSRRPVFSFQDRGWSVRIAPSGSAWSWTATRDGKRGSGTGATKIEALDQARIWITKLQLEAAANAAAGIVTGIVDAVTDDDGGAGNSSSSSSGDSGLPPLPVPTPLGPGPIPVEPTPLGGSLSGGRGLRAPPLKTLRGGGIFWRPATNTILLYDLAQFVMTAFTSKTDPYTSDPRKIVEQALQTALPALDLVAYGPTLKITTAAGDQLTLDETAMAVGMLQVELNSPGLGEEVPAFAADILHEAIFDTEQQQDVEPFAFRGRMLYARQSGGGYRGAIVQQGVVSYTDDVSPSVADALQDAIEAVRKQDGV